jgi:uncharacterized membrane protein (UPF0136 family)
MLFGIHRLAVYLPPMHLAQSLIVLVPLAMFTIAWLLISRVIRTARSRKRFLRINLTLAILMVAWIFEINYFEAPSASMMISTPLTFEFFHIALGLIAALIIRYLEPNAKPGPKP